MQSTFNPVTIIPSYNTGRSLLISTVSNVLKSGIDIILVIDGSTDGSADQLESILGNPSQLSVLKKSKNTGKGDSVYQGMKSASAQGYTHAVVIDSDGQHPMEAIQPMLSIARDYPSALIMGKPEFGEEAPWVRVQGRKLTSFWTDVETLWCGLGDTLFGMRVYPIIPFMEAFRQTPFARGFDFDPEIAVRMIWLGCQPIQFTVPVRYLEPAEGGISHFHYLRDNVKLTFLHFRLIPELLLRRLPGFIKNKKAWKNI